MTQKEEAYQLHLKGLSYKEIGDKLNISKTTAFEYVKEVRLTRGKKIVHPVPNSSEPVLNGNSERILPNFPKIPNERSEQKKEEKKVEKMEPIPPPKPIPVIKIFTGDELLKKQFVSLPFEGKFKELIGRPEKLFSGVIWGLPKSGKSNLAIRFADYLQEYFGKVIYFAVEEGIHLSFQQKIKEIGGSKMTVIDTRDRDAIRDYLKANDADFVFIDSINVAGIDAEFLGILKTENLTKSFIAIVQATKSGNFKGDQALTHNCDFVIEVIEGVAHHEGRFGPVSEMKFFDGKLYEKNSNNLSAPETKKLPPGKAVLKMLDWDTSKMNTEKIKKEKILQPKLAFKPKVTVPLNGANVLGGFVLVGGSLLLASWIKRIYDDE